MTINQKTQASQTLQELKTLAPSVQWFTSWNFYTKLPEFSAIKDGAVEFSMHRRDWMAAGQSKVNMEIRINSDARLSDNGMLVSPGLQRPIVAKSLSQLSFKRYLQFVKDNIGLLEVIGG